MGAYTRDTTDHSQCRCAQSSDVTGPLNYLAWLTPVSFNGAPNSLKTSLSSLTTRTNFAVYLACSLARLGPKLSRYTRLEDIKALPKRNAECSGVLEVLKRSKNTTRIIELEIGQIRCQVRCFIQRYSISSNPLFPPFLGLLDMLD